MSLVHEFENSGNWLFRRRSWFPVLFAIPGFIILWFTNPLIIKFDLREEIIFLAVSLAGQLVRVLTVGFAPGNTSGRNTAGGQIADELNTTGIYSLVRHPLYIGNFFMWLGPVLFLRSAWFAVIFFLVYWIYYERIMFAEEQYLRKKFGDLYDRWAEKTNAVLPSFRHYKAPSLTFSLKTVLRREYNSFINIFVIFTALDFVRNYSVDGKPAITPFWLYLFAGAAIIWLIIRTIHKTSSFLTVPGR